MRMICVTQQGFVEALQHTSRASWRPKQRPCQNRDSMLSVQNTCIGKVLAMKVVVNHLGPVFSNVDIPAMPSNRCPVLQPHVEPMVNCTVIPVGTTSFHCHCFIHSVFFATIAIIAWHCVCRPIGCNDVGHAMFYEGGHNDYTHIFTV